MREKNNLQAEYDLLTNKKKVLNAYGRFVKRRYLQYFRQFPHMSSTEISKMASQDWKKLPIAEKDRLHQEYEDEKNDQEMGIDKSDQINEYLDRLDDYNKALEEDKEKVLRKYGLNA